MSKAANSIHNGLEEAVAYAKGRAPKKHYRIHVPEHVDVKAIRTKLGMTRQARSLARFGFSINTLRLHRHVRTVAHPRSRCLSIRRPSND